MKIHTVTNGHSAAYLVEHEEKVMLVDTSVPGTAPAILAKLKEVGGRLTLIVLTHHHADHCGSANQIREATGAPIAVHHLDAAQLRTGGRVELTPTGLVPRLLIPLLGRTPIPATAPDLELGDAEDLSGFGGIGRSFWTPGHTPGSQSVLLPDNVVLAGDALAGGFVRPRRAHGPMFVTDAAAAARSVSTIASASDGSGVWVAHGGLLQTRSVQALNSRHGATRSTG